MKTHVITLSKVFMRGHPRAGDETRFKLKFLNGLKTHTFRSNYDFWAKKVLEVQKGDAMLSVREWSGNPYNSPQIIIKNLTQKNNIGIQRFKFDERANLFVDNEPISYPMSFVVANNGFSQDSYGIKDFHNWLGVGKGVPVEGCIIHFNSFRYA